jgi:hypothetical protein
VINERKCNLVVSFSSVDQEDVSVLLTIHIFGTYFKLKYFIYPQREIWDRFFNFFNKKVYFQSDIAQYSKREWKNYSPMNYDDDD